MKPPWEKIEFSINDLLLNIYDWVCKSTGSILSIPFQFTDAHNSYVLL